MIFTKSKKEVVAAVEKHIADYQEENIKKYGEIRHCEFEPDTFLELRNDLYKEEKAQYAHQRALCEAIQEVEPGICSECVYPFQHRMDLENCPGFCVYAEKQVKKKNKPEKKERTKTLTLSGVPDLPPIKTETIEEETDLNGLLGTLKKWLHIEEDYNITAPVCAFAGNSAQGESDVIGMIQPSGSNKTEIIRSFGETENQFVYPISSITEHTLVSGHRDNIDTVPLLRGRVVAIKDLTTLLSKKDDIRAEVFGQIRELTDGYIRCEFGNGVKKEYTGIHSSILFGCTNAIERYYSMYSNLGARMMFIRPRNDPKKAREQSLKNQPHLKEMRAELHKMMMGFLSWAIKKIKDGLPEMVEETATEIGCLCDFVAVARCQIHHSRETGDIDEIPEPEFPTRIYNTVMKLTKIHALIHGRDKVAEEDKGFAVRFISDNIPTTRAAVLSVLNEDWKSTSELSEASGISPASLRYILMELVSLGICDRLPRELKDEHADKRSDDFRVRGEYTLILEQLRPTNRLGGRFGEDKRSVSQSNNTIPLDSLVSIPPQNGYEIREVKTTNLKGEPEVSFQIHYKGALIETYQTRAFAERKLKTFTESEHPPTTNAGGSSCP